MKGIQHNLGRRYYENGASPTNSTGMVSKSMLWAFNQSPYKWFYGPPMKSTPAMEFGTLVHDLLLSPGDCDKYVTSPYDSYRTNEAKAWRDEQIAAGKSVVTKDDLGRARNIEQCLRDHPQMIGLGSYASEVAVYGKIGSTQCRGMIDIVPEEEGYHLVDLKTTSNIGTAADVQRTILNRGYHWQAAMYLDLWNAATNEDRDKFMFIFVEVDAPHEIAILTLAPELIAHGRNEYLAAIKRYQNCLSTGIWPGAIGNDVLEVGVPAWLKL
jgi:hypothetical protein